ncbi:hypothetical protein DLAC_02721 [Tieghemostelium lacteum]|uniref:Uncharacterized protein n=1 Tax=Tieghemostelium lacteum TaxID=361077 RepID=A0A152A339_TIELA|nr:hypothetical protein DLAC_02721 [Tieghemostelium lacteum]|eukprot:KYR00682.1 hypothetical protein DLAC_02721 [Tieghemostelium lacteum]
MKREDEDEIQFKPPDRSTSAPPSFLASHSLFAFRANEDIRSDENYLEYYLNHQNQDKLPPPLEIQNSFYHLNEGNDFITNGSGIQQLPPGVTQFQQNSFNSGNSNSSLNNNFSQREFYQEYFKNTGLPQTFQQQQSRGFQQFQLFQFQQQQQFQNFQLQQQVLQQRQQQQQQFQQPQRPSQYPQQPQPQHQQQQQQQFQQNNFSNGINHHQQPQYQNGNNEVWNRMSKLSINDPIKSGHDDYITKSAYDVAFSTVNQFLDDNSSANANGMWKDQQQVFEPLQPRSNLNNSGKQQQSVISPMRNTNQQQQNNNGKLHAPTPINTSLENFLKHENSNGNDELKKPIATKPNSQQQQPLQPQTIPSRTPTPPSGTSPSSQFCRFYTQGFCSRGSKCNYVHEQADPSLEKPIVNSVVIDDHNNNIVNGINSNNITPTTPNNNTNTNNNHINLSNNINSNNSNNTTSPTNTNNNINNNNSTTNNNTSSNSNTNNNNSNKNNKNQNRKSNDQQNNFQQNNNQKNQNQNSKNQKNQNNSKQNNNNSQQNNNQQNQQSSISTSSSSINGTYLSQPMNSDVQSKIDFISNKSYGSVDQLYGSIYPLCRDQHGCRFLQKKLEDNETQLTEVIFKEVCDYMLELMTDPFGNYLCQKLLEHCNDQQRLAIIERVGADIVRISMNMHGTRAVQKMIEYLTTPEQINLIKLSLKDYVVPLIQDLNGNHVIQKCLNKLSPADNQFIYDSVSAEGNCVAVATHRHGCCVLQRCIDHASESQKLQLIHEVIKNALVLVQDPYGNYVVQYVLDLPFNGLASEMAKRFFGNVPILATQKFSSNVVEKCLSVTDPTTRGVLIQEVIDYNNLLHLLQDPYANYVIQTSLTISEPHQHTKLVEAIRPHLPQLKNTPFGKRIILKINKEG